MKKGFVKIFLVFVFLSGLTFIFRDSASAVSREDCENRLGTGEFSLDELRECEGILKALYQEAGAQKKTLQSEIDRFNTSIAITANRILQTTEEIEKLGSEIGALSSKIGRLDISLDQISEVLIGRIAETYKRSYIDPLGLLFSSHNFSDFFSRYKYLSAIQLHDKQLMLQMETVRTDYEGEKETKEDKQAEQQEAKKKLETQKAILAQQKTSKENFLVVTQNNEKRYQQLLDEAKREVQSLLASKFSEKRDVARGEVIGLMGNTGFSFGSHLHFGIYDLKEDQANDFDYFSGVNNPFDYLSGKSVVFEASACDDTSSNQTKTVGNGSWAWPMSNPRITQCYAHTPWSWRYSGDFHHGADMADKDDIYVRSVEQGVAYFYRAQGSFGNNVRIFHPDGKMSLYLHLQ